MALARDRKRINVKGATGIYIRELDPSATAAFSLVGETAGTTIADLHDMVRSKNEQGLTVNNQSSGEGVNIKVRLLQSSIDEIQLLKNAKGKYYELHIPVTLANGQVLDLDFPLAKITPGLTLDFKPGERQIEMDVEVLAIKATSTVTRAPVAYNIDPSVNPYYVEVQGAAPGQGSPTESAGTLTTLISNIL